MPKRQQSPAKSTAVAPPSNELFIDTYQAAENTAQVAKKLSMRPTAVANRAARLRARGVKLKLMPNSRGARGPAYYTSLAERAQKALPK